MDCSCQIGQRCSFGGCTAQGTRDGVQPSRDVPGSAWCSLHAALDEAERTRIWRERVEAQEMRDRDAAR